MINRCPQPKDHCFETLRKFSTYVEVKCKKCGCEQFWMIAEDRLEEVEQNGIDDFGFIRKEEEKQPQIKKEFYV